MTQSEFFEILGYLSSPRRGCKLDAEMHSRAQRKFESKYLRVTGVAPIIDNHNYYVLHEYADKWGGVELRIYFDSDRKTVPEIIRAMIRSSRPGEPRDSRINDNKLIWKLIGYGFLLGDVQDASRIRNHVPIQHIADFERGFFVRRNNICRRFSIQIWPIY